MESNPIISFDDYEELSFQVLLNKQSISKYGKTIQQLGQKGYGYLCLRHKVELTEEVRQDFICLLQTADVKVFRTAWANDEFVDPTRLHWDYKPMGT